MYLCIYLPLYRFIFLCILHSSIYPFCLFASLHIYLFIYSSVYSWISACMYIFIYVCICRIVTLPLYLFLISSYLSIMLLSICLLISFIDRGLSGLRRTRTVNNTGTNSRVIIAQGEKKTALHPCALNPRASYHIERGVFVHVISGKVPIECNLVPPQPIHGVPTTRR